MKKTLLASKPFFRFMEDWHRKNRLADKLKDVESPEMFRATIGFDFVFAFDTRGQKHCYCIELNGQEAGTWGIADIEGVDHLRKIMTLSRNTFHPERQKLRVAIEDVQNDTSLEAEEKASRVAAMDAEKKQIPLAAYAFVNPPEIEELAEDKGLQAAVIPKEHALRVYELGSSPEAGSGYWVVKPRVGRRGDSINVLSNEEFKHFLVEDTEAGEWVAQEYVRAAGADRAPEEMKDNPASMRLLIDFRVLEDGTIHVVHEDGYQRVGRLSSRQSLPTDTGMSVVNKARGARAVDRSDAEFQMAHEVSIKTIRNLALYYKEHASLSEDGGVMLRPVTVADIPKLTALEKSVAGQETYSPMLEAHEWEEEIGRTNVFLVEHNSKVVGNASYELKPDGSAYISGLVIEPAFQGKGIARKAMSALLEKLQGVKNVWLVTHPENMAAVHLYQSLGFVVGERVENYYGDGQPRIKMSLKRE